MLRNLIILFVFSLLPIAILAADAKYPVSEIPEDLKKDVNAVVRENKMVYKIINQGKASLYVYMAITILNDNANSYAQKIIPYNKGIEKIRDINGFSYDESGKPIKKLRNKDIYEQSSFDGVSLFTDNRFKAIDLTQNNFPYTVEFEYEIEYDYTFHSTDDFINESEKTSVQHFTFQIIYPPALQPRYKVYNIDDSHKVQKLPDGLESIEWEYENIKPLKSESFGLAYYPHILSAPSKFEFGGYAGEMSTWDQYGQWIASLNRGRDVLPEEAKAKIRELTSNCKTTEEKTRKVYQYLQEKTRYVSIQLGIGGYQPFEAAVVEKTGYGDCKALSNYTIALLAVAGVKANYVLISAGPDANRIKEDFPSSQFNHATVCVPNGADTIWLECTDQTTPFGFAGTFTGNRKALAITENGARIVSTPKYGADTNIQTRTAEVMLDMNGNAKAKVRTTYSGLQYENGDLDAYLDNQYDNQKKWIQRNTQIGSFDIVSFSFKNNKDRIPSAVLDLELNLNRLATISSKRVFLVPNLMNRVTYIPEKIDQRKTNVVLKNAFTHIDTVRYLIPQELYPEYLPEAQKVKSRFGEYEASYKLDQGSLIYIRKMRRVNGEFSPESYSELIDFYKSINKADNAKIVFLNKT